MARETRDLFESYRAALAFGMQAAWAQVKVARGTQAVIAGLAHRAYSPLIWALRPQSKSQSHRMSLARRPRAASTRSTWARKMRFSAAKYSVA
jgi:hypothetical protein